MKKYSLALLLSSVSVLFFFSCKKINEATTIGGDLIPPVDNVNTFADTLDVLSSSLDFDDTTRTFFSDQVPLGALNDPEFGQTRANVYFNISSNVYGTYPFLVDRRSATYQDSLKIDSVVLSLAYTGSYGDTNTMQTVTVREIAQTSTFNDTTLFQYNADNQAAFQTTGSVLGSKTFFIRDLNDSFFYRRKSDSAKRVNVLRIRFDPSQGEALGRRFASFDTVSGPNGGFRNDSIFKTIFKGLAVETGAPSGSGGLAYFNLTGAETKLIIYFRATKNNAVDTTSVEFTHRTNGQANLIKRTYGGSFNSNANLVYIQSAPGTYARIRIPQLDTLSNRVVHRAELIAAVENPFVTTIFAPPSRLMLDRVRRDSAFSFERDLQAGADGSINFGLFGGNLKSDGTYRINITRYVQGIVTRNETNDTLRLYAPLRTILYDRSFPRYIAVPGISRIAEGRVVLAGGTHPDPAKRMRVRIIYSRL